MSTDMDVLVAQYNISWKDVFQVSLFKLNTIIKWN